MLETKNLNAGYGNLQILYDISFKVREKRITSIVGPNGSGKSTLLKTIIGLTRVYSGEIIYEENEISKVPPHKRVAMGIAYLPQTESVFTSLTIHENFIISGYLLDKDNVQNKINDLLDFFPPLKPYIDKKVWKLSGGERQMVALAMALMRDPKIIMFDEPCSNLAPKLMNEVMDTIRTLNQELGITIILVEQNVTEALSISDTAYLLVSGRMEFEGGANELLNHPDLRKLYLGV
ncbi:High-affinity branched-chain amino acid transport ATP-binding protein LivF [subsurface metagenome]